MVDLGLGLEAMSDLVFGLEVVVDPVLNRGEVAFVQCQTWIKAFWGNAKTDHRVIARIGPRDYGRAWSRTGCDRA